MTSPLQPVLYPAQGTAGPILYLNPYSGTYTSNRAYGLRMQRGYQAGLPQWMARRYGPTGEAPRVSESEQRRQRFLERWGFEERVWRRLYTKYIKQINEMASPEGQITKADIQRFNADTPMTGLGLDWLENRLAGKLIDMHGYRNHSIPPQQYTYYDPTQDINRSATDLKFWWYH